jgi:hypothetical protein
MDGTAPERSSIILQKDAIFRMIYPPRKAHEIDVFGLVTINDLEVKNLTFFRMSAD